MINGKKNAPTKEETNRNNAAITEARICVATLAQYQELIIDW